MEESFCGIAIPVSLIKDLQRVCRLTDAELEEIVISLRSSYDVLKATIEKYPDNWKSIVFVFGSGSRRGCVKISNAIGEWQLEYKEPVSIEVSGIRCKKLNELHGPPKELWFSVLRAEKYSWEGTISISDVDIPLNLLCRTIWPCGVTSEELKGVVASMKASCEVLSEIYSKHAPVIGGIEFYWHTVFFCKEQELDLSLRSMRNESCWVLSTPLGSWMIYMCEEVSEDFFPAFKRCEESEEVEYAQKVRSSTPEISSMKKLFSWIKLAQIEHFIALKGEGQEDKSPFAQAEVKLHWVYEIPEEQITQALEGLRVGKVIVEDLREQGWEPEFSLPQAYFDGKQPKELLLKYNSKERYWTLVSPLRIWKWKDRAGEDFVQKYARCFTFISDRECYEIDCWKGLGKIALESAEGSKATIPIPPDEVAEWFKEILNNCCVDSAR